jgi:hypothetical protein
MEAKWIRVGAAILAVAAAAGVVATAVAGTSHRTASSCDLSEFDRQGVQWRTESARDVVDAINAKRTQLGVAPVGIDVTLWAEATWQAGALAVAGKPRSTCTLTADAYLGGAGGSGGPTGNANALSTGTHTIAFDSPHCCETSAADVEGTLKGFGVQPSAIGDLYSGRYTAIGVGFASGAFPSLQIDLSPEPATAPPPSTVSTRSATVHIAPTFTTGGSPRFSSNLLSGASGAFQLASARVTNGYLGGGGRLQLTYAPFLHFHGVDALTYSVADLYGRSATGVLRLVVGDGKQQFIGLPRGSASLGVGYLGGYHVVQLDDLAMSGRVSVSTPDGGRVELIAKRHGVVVGRRTVSVPRLRNNNAIDGRVYGDPLNALAGGLSVGPPTVGLSIMKIVPRSRLALGGYTLTAVHDGRQTSSVFNVCKQINIITLGCGSFVIGGH